MCRDDTSATSFTIQTTVLKQRWGGYDRGQLYEHAVEGELLCAGIDLPDQGVRQSYSTIVGIVKLTEFMEIPLIAMPAKLVILGPG